MTARCCTRGRESPSSRVSGPRRGGSKGDGDSRGRADPKAGAFRSRVSAGISENAELEYKGESGGLPPIYVHVCVCVYVYIYIYNIYIKNIYMHVNTIPCQTPAGVERVTRVHVRVRTRVGVRGYARVRMRFFHTTVQTHFTSLRDIRHRVYFISAAGRDEGRPSRGGMTKGEVFRAWSAPSLRRRPLIREPVCSKNRTTIITLVRPSVRFGRSSGSRLATRRKISARISNFGRAEPSRSTLLFFFFPPYFPFFFYQKEQEAGYFPASVVRDTPSIDPEAFR